MGTRIRAESAMRVRSGVRGTVVNSPPTGFLPRAAKADEGLPRVYVRRSIVTSDGPAKEGTRRGHVRGGCRHAATASRHGDVVPTNTSPRVRAIGANYFDSLSQSQVWVNIEPQPTERGPAPFILNVTVAFPGRRLDHQPPAVSLRAQTRCFPMEARTYSAFVH